MGRRERDGEGRKGRGGQRDGLLRRGEENVRTRVWKVKSELEGGKDPSVLFSYIQPIAKITHTWGIAQSK